jgi:hypothetical protein
MHTDQTGLLIKLELLVAEIDKLASLLSCKDSWPLRQPKRFELFSLTPLRSLLECCRPFHTATAFLPVAARREGWAAGSSSRIEDEETTPHEKEPPMTDAQRDARLSAWELMTAIFILDLRDRRPELANAICERLDAASQSHASPESTAASDTWLSVLRGQTLALDFRFPEPPKDQ